MTDYVYAFIFTAVAAVIVEMLATTGTGGRLGGAARLVAGLCMLVMLLDPLQEGISFIRSLADGRMELTWEGETSADESYYKDILQEELAGLGRSEVAAWVTAVMDSQFGIPAENHTVTVSVTPAEDGGLPAVTGITIVLHGASVFENPHQIEAYITDRSGYPCTVAIQ